MDDAPKEIMVHVKIFRHASPRKDTVQLSAGARVRDLMARVEERHFAPEEEASATLLRKGIARDDLLFILNGHLLKNPDGLDMPLKDGDEFIVFPALAGG